LSGPLADRIDIHVAVGAVPLRALTAATAVEATSERMRLRVEGARDRQLDRYRDGDVGIDVTCNAHASGRWLALHTGIAAPARDLLGAAADRLSLSARAYHRVLKVARTIADLEGDQAVGVAAVAEALRYRPADSPLAATRAGAAEPSAG
jgi:magnesium chelatase family protein